MRQSWRARLVGLALPLLLPAGGRADALGEVERQQQELFERAAPSVVFVSSAEGMGSGFFVSSQGLILTNAHVVGENTTVRVVASDGVGYAGTVVKRAANNLDLALVQIPDKARPALPLLEKATLRVGSWVATIGHSRGGIWSFNTGMISNIYPDGADRPVFQTQIPINPGASGGPVFDTHGRVIGIVTAKLKDAEGMNFAIRTDVALQAFDELEGLCECVTVLAPPGVAVFANGRMAGLGPRVKVAANPQATLEISAVVGGRLSKRVVRYPEQRSLDLR